MKTKIRHKQSLGILFLLLFSVNCFAQKKGTSSINRENYFSLLIPKERVEFLTEGEIEIILAGELKNLGIKTKNYNCSITQSNKNNQGKVIAWLEVYPFLQGIFLDLSKSPVNAKNRFDTKAETTGFKCHQWSDPIELPYRTIKQSSYWYQQKKESKDTLYVTRSVIVDILREDIKQLVDTITKEADESRKASVEAYKSAKAIYDKGMTELKNKNAAAAIELFNQASQKGFHNYSTDLYYNRGNAYFEAGNKEAACKDWLDAVQRGNKQALEIYNTNCK